MNIEIEEWKVIDNYENYQVSNLGRVKNVITNQILKPCKYNKHYYAVTLNGKKHRIHRLVMSAFVENPKNKPFVDHIDRDPSNNKLINLRWATEIENQQNKSMQRNNTTGFIGVVWDKQKNKWKAQIGLGNKMINLGVYNLREDAINARKTAEIKYFGDFRAK